MAALGTGAIVFGIWAALTVSVGAYRAAKDRGFAAVAFAIGLLEAIAVLASMVFSVVC